MSVAERSKKWRLNHPERYLALSRKRRLQNPEKTKATDKKWRENHPEKCKAIAAEYHRKHRDCILQRKRDGRFQKYGLTEKEFYAILAEQGGVCAICRTSNWGGLWGVPRVDHDHESGDVRGLLCNACNMMLGLMGDNPERLSRASEYLRDCGTAVKRKR